MKEKERIFIETCDALTRLNNIIKKNAGTGDTEPVIDITGEEDRGGSSSNVLSCNKCTYKTSQAKNLNEHKKSDHQVSLIPCDLCDYVGKCTADYNNHVKDKHSEQNTAANNRRRTGVSDKTDEIVNNEANDTVKDKDNNKEKAKTKVNNKTETQQRKQNNIEIPCDLCKFKSKSADDFINHIETKHQSKGNNSSEKPCYECDRCDYKGTVEEYFKKHLESAHNLNVGVKKPSVTNYPKKLCMNWNRGFCSYDDNKCRFEHKDMQACMYRERCSRRDCTFWHEAQSGKFPFLDYYQQQFNPNLQPRMNVLRRN